MNRAWRIVFFVAAIAILAPSVAALSVALLGKLMGCEAEAETCAGGLGAVLGTTLSWSWHRILDPVVLALLTAAAAIGAALGFADRRTAILWSAMGACWGPIAALMLPYMAVSLTMPRACHLIEGGAANCVVWGHPMGDAYAGAGAAFWFSIFVVPIGLGGIAMTFIFAWLVRPPAASPRARP